MPGILMSQISDISGQIQIHVLLELKIRLVDLGVAGCIQLSYTMGTQWLGEGFSN